MSESEKKKETQKKRWCGKVQGDTHKGGLERLAA